MSDSLSPYSDFDLEEELAAPQSLADEVKRMVPPAAVLPFEMAQRMDKLASSREERERAELEAVTAALAKSARLEKRFDVLSSASRGLTLAADYYKRTGSADSTPLAEAFRRVAARLLGILSAEEFKLFEKAQRALDFEAAFIIIERALATAA